MVFYLSIIIVVGLLSMVSSLNSDDEVKEYQFSDQRDKPYEDNG